MNSNEGQSTSQPLQEIPLINPVPVSSRTVSASPLLFSMVTICALVWTVLVWTISLDYVLTEASPSSIVAVCLFSLTVIITLAVMLNRRVFFAPGRGVVVVDRLFSRVIYRRSIPMMSCEDVKVEIFARNWYAFLANTGAQPKLITHARTDSEMAMDLVEMFEQQAPARTKVAS